MRFIPVGSRRILPLVALLVLPLHLGAQERQLFTWTGRVDRQVRLTMQGKHTEVDAGRGEQYSGRFRAVGELPRVEGRVRVVVSGGRGQVSVLQQPNEDNDYTAIVRVADRSAGADRYLVTAFFTPDDRGRLGRGRDRDDRDRDNRGRDDRDRDNRGRGNDGDDDRRGRGPAVLRWTGQVDAQAEIRWQGGTVRQRALNGNPLREVNSSVNSSVNSTSGIIRPRLGSEVTISRREGRGDIDIVQQPSAANGYTTIIRVNDPQGGYGRYTFEVTRQ